MHTVYHICRKQDKHNNNKGYIGVTCNLKKRIIKHKSEPVNWKMKMALSKYTDLVAYPLKKFKDRDSALEYEGTLRPKNNMGWNIMRGGFISATGVKRTEKHIKKIRDTASKSYWITFPDGKKKKIKNLTKFARDNGIKMHSARASGKIGEFTYKRVGNQEFKQNRYIVTNPEGEEIKVNWLTLFCKENKLTKQRMYALANGEGKTHKGWKCRKEEV